MKYILIAVLLFAIGVTGVHAQQIFNDRVMAVNTKLNAVRAAVAHAQIDGKVTDDVILYVRTVSGTVQELSNTAFTFSANATVTTTMDEVNANEQRLRTAEVITEELLGYAARKGIVVNVLKE